MRDSSRAEHKKRRKKCVPSALGMTTVLAARLVNAANRTAIGREVRYNAD